MSKRIGFFFSVLHHIFYIFTEILIPNIISKYLFKPCPTRRVLSGSVQGMYPPVCNVSFSTETALWQLTRSQGGVCLTAVVCVCYRKRDKNSSKIKAKQHKTLKGNNLKCFTSAHSGKLEYLSCLNTNSGWHLILQIKGKWPLNEYRFSVKNSKRASLF